MKGEIIFKYGDDLLKAEFYLEGGWELYIVHEGDWTVCNYKGIFLTRKEVFEYLAENP